MGTDYNHEIGYESLLADFKRYQKQTPKGVSLQNKRNRTIALKFKIGDKSCSKGCACSFTLDGMVEALSKANKVAEKLKESSSETEFEQWYGSDILKKSVINNDLLTFRCAITLVEDDFWNRLSRTKRKLDKDDPSAINSWIDTYGRFFRRLSQDKIVNLSDIKAVIETQRKGTKTYKGVVSAMKRLARFANHDSILDSLSELEVTQTDFRDLQTVTLKDFLDWRDKTLGVTASLDDRADLDSRKAWLWVFSMQVVYGLRISEVFAIQNLSKSLATKDGVSIPALSNDANTENLIYVGDKTIIGTSTKTGSRISRPIIPPKYSDLIELLEIKKPLVPSNRPRSNQPKALANFLNKTARIMLVKWDAPTTETHAFRHLANINGMQAGISLEVRAQSLGHTPAMNDSVYKKRQHTQTTIDLLLNSNSQAIDFVTALNEAKTLAKDNPDCKQVIAKLLAKIYQKDSSEIIKLL